MGLMSTLALLTLPLLKRPELASKSLPETLDPRVIENAALRGERDRQYEENAALIARIAELEAEIDDLNSRLDQARHDRDEWYHLAVRHQVLDSGHQALQDSRQLAAQAQMQQVNAQQFMNAQAQAHQVGLWHDCTCVPGRSAALGILTRGY